MKLFNFFSKSKQNEKLVAMQDKDIFQIRSAFFDVIEQQNVLTDTIKILMSMADRQKFIYMWLKDAEDRYIFATKNTREVLFDNKHISKIINRTDTEISSGKKICSCVEKEIANLTPEDLPNISKYIEKDTLICNLTDVITRCFNKPCKFVEVINGMVWIVWKEPMFNDNIYSGSVGYAIDMTNQSDEVYQLIQERVSTKEAFKIDGTDNYYLTTYSFPELRPRRFI
jgi:hypothetical protein